MKLAKKCPGWMDGWVDVKAILRIACNKKMGNFFEDLMKKGLDFILIHHNQPIFDDIIN